MYSMLRFHVFQYEKFDIYNTVTGRYTISESVYILQSRSPAVVYVSHLSPLRRLTSPLFPQRPVDINPSDTMLL